MPNRLAACLPNTPRLTPVERRAYSRWSVIAEPRRKAGATHWHATKSAEVSNCGISTLRDLRVVNHGSVRRSRNRELQNAFVSGVVLRPAGLFERRTHACKRASGTLTFPLMACILLVCRPLKEADSLDCASARPP